MFLYTHTYTHTHTRLLNKTRLLKLRVCSVQLARNQSGKHGRKVLSRCTRDAQKKRRKRRKQKEEKKRIFSKSPTVQLIFLVYFPFPCCFFTFLSGGKPPFPFPFSITSHLSQTFFTYIYMYIHIDTHIHTHTYIKFYLHRSALLDEKLEEKKREENHFDRLP